MKWIKCDDSVPNDGRRVLTLKGWFVDIDQYLSPNPKMHPPYSDEDRLPFGWYKWNFRNYCFDPSLIPTHWMELPDVPEHPKENNEVD
jgi:hypothetical protein